MVFDHQNLKRPTGGSRQYQYANGTITFTFVAKGILMQASDKLLGTIELLFIWDDIESNDLSGYVFRAF